MHQCRRRGAKIHRILSLLLVVLGLEVVKKNLFQFLFKLVDQLLLLVLLLGLELVDQLLLLVLLLGVDKELCLLVLQLGLLLQMLS